VEAADCLLILNDASSSELEGQHASVKLTLDELATAGIPRVEAFNKADRLDPAARGDLLRRYPGTTLMSAASGEGLDEVLARVEEALSRKWLLREIDAPAAEAGSWTARLYASAQILDRRVLGEKIRFRLRVTAENWTRLQSLLTPAE
jgi:GTP-binding protein HflX